MHAQTAYQGADFEDGSCVVTEQLCDTVLSLPIHPYITEEEVLQVCELIVKYMQA